MRLHIMPDEKIINRTIQYFEKVWPAQNRYIVFVNKRNAKTQHVDRTLSDDIIVANINDYFIDDIIKDIDSYSTIIIHYLTIEAATFVSRINHNNIMWIEWGGDMYNAFLLRKGFQIYSDYDKVLSLKFKFIPNRVAKIIIEKRRERRFAVLYNAVKKIKYFIPDSMYGEYPLFLSYYPEFSHLKYREFFYYPIQEIVGEENIGKRASGSLIVVGNSASETNNHIDAIEKLSNINVANRVLMPLSYGAGTCYTQFVLEAGKYKLKERFEPITDFMPLSEYNTLLYGASFFIYASYRQEAVGNILFAFYIGGKVFLRRSNPLYDFYKGLGLVLYAFEDIDSYSFEETLSDDQYLNNKRIIETTYSNQRMLDLIKNTFPDE